MFILNDTLTLSAIFLANLVQDKLDWGIKSPDQKAPPVHSAWELTAWSKYLAEKRSRFYLSCQLLHLGNTFFISLHVYWTVQQNAINLLPDNHLRPLSNHNLHVLLLPTTSCLHLLPTSQLNWINSLSFVSVVSVFPCSLLQRSEQAKSLVSHLYPSSLSLILSLT